MRVTLGILKKTPDKFDFSLFLQKECNQYR